MLKSLKEYLKHFKHFKLSHFMSTSAHLCVASVGGKRSVVLGYL